MKVLVQQERKALILKVVAQEQLTTKVSFKPGQIVDHAPDNKGAAPYHLNYCGYEPCLPGYEFGPFVRKSFLLHMVARGSGTLLKGEASYSVCQGQIFAIYPGEVTTYRASKEDPWKYYWIGFSGYEAETIMEKMGFSREMPVISVNNVSCLIECVENILSLSRDSLGDELGRTGEMLRFFSSIIKARPEKRSPGKSDRNEYAEYAQRFISNNFDKNIKIAELARQIGINRSYLTKTFTDIYKMSPQEFLIRVRLDHAADLLTHTTISISEIAVQCGYPDIFAFSRMFHKHLGCSPGEYRTRFTSE